MITLMAGGCFPLTAWLDGCVPGLMKSSVRNQAGMNAYCATLGWVCMAVCMGFGFGRWAPGYGCLLGSTYFNHRGKNGISRRSNLTSYFIEA